MKLFQLFIPVLLFPFATASCVTEINEACQEQLETKNEVAKGIVNSLYPPLKNAWKNYTETYQKYLVSNISSGCSHCFLVVFQDCASEQDCYKGKLNESIFETARDYIGTKTYPFDHSCLRLVLQKVYDGGDECTHQFGDDLVSIFWRDSIFGRPVFQVS